MKEPKRNAAGRTWLLLGAVSVVAGLVVVLVAAGVIESPESSRQAPDWVIGLAGSVFVVVGLYVALVGVVSLRDPDYMARLRRGTEFNVGGWLVSAFVFSAFFALAAWAAFGPGPRSFSGGAGGFGVEVSAPGGERVGRTVFGISAVLLGLGGVWVWTYGIRRLLKRGEDTRFDE